MPEFLVDACVVSFNTKDLTLKTLQQFRPSTHLPVNLMVWDNASKDGTQQALAEFGIRNPVTTILSPKNLGYGTALNRAFSLGKAPYLLCLNSDLEFPTVGWLEQMVQFLQADPKKAVAGPLLIDKMGRCGGAGVVGSDRSPIIRFWQKPMAQVEQHLRSPKEVLSVCGACYLIKREVFDRVGGFDERYPFYHEETHLSRLVRSYGYQVWFHPARVVHIWNGSPNPDNTTKAKFFQETKAVFESSWGDNRTIEEV